MIPLIQNNMEAIQNACKKYHVKSLYLVGSATDTGRFTDESDVDFLYRFRKEDIEEMAYADNYFDLMFYLQDLLNRKVDLVAEEKMWNPYFIESINKSKQIIYES
jgi:predicted nucleotidyltransferase